MIYLVFVDNYDSRVGAKVEDVVAKEIHEYSTDEIAMIVRSLLSKRSMPSIVLVISCLWTTTEAAIHDRVLFNLYRLSSLRATSRS